MEILFYVVAALLAGYILGRVWPRKTDGGLEVSSTDHSKIFQLEITTEPEDLAKKSHIVLAVKLVEDQ